MATTIYLIRPETYPVPPSFTNEKSLDFDGVDEFVDCGQPTVFDGATNWSISFWLKFDTNGNYSPVGYRGGSEAPNTNIQFLWANTISRMQFSIGSAYHRTSVASNVVSGAWRHFVAVYDGTQGTNADRLKIYVDGSFDTPSLTSGTFPTSMNAAMSGGASDRVFNIGKYNGGVYEIDGKVDEVAIFNYSLGASDITTMYNSGTAYDLDLLTTPPVHWWRCGDGDTFPTITDVGTVGGFDGTMTNMESGDIVTDVP